ncbi:MAG: hypothetical protein ACFFFH_09100 [Candidatus Thorarchaeota archaeon]
MDHHWGSKLHLFLSDGNVEYSSQIRLVLSKELPYTFPGYSTNWSASDTENSITSC